ncbi:prolipoprotein diacylglyceryl transferase family protein [Paenibacillus sp. GCM10012307]|uniref:Prolipoprotein diacylglyceryl transferase n=1 Tax=Paenibacillus roseus TaxID=2798579 RepID=A0A934J473_9BACL|nr:prolipoprotein diacylglyceryl transferase family protein [Paenibacillus roseus]MBJ6362535.1 prolipoprotein diacylglyceryl transferase [Paenibacillus roseus]
MPDILQFGPFIIKADWLLWGISAVAGYFAMQRLIKSSHFADRSILDKLVNSFMIVLLVWKFSPLLFSPSILWNDPYRLITMAGSPIGLWVGVTVAVLYMFKSMRRMKVPVVFVLDLLAIGLVISVLVYSLIRWQYGLATSLPWGISIENPQFKYHPINVYIVLVTVPLFIYIWRQQSKVGSGDIFILFLTYFGLGMMLVSLFKAKTIFLLGLSGQQVVYVVMMAAGVVLSIVLNKKKSG